MRRAGDGEAGHRHRRAGRLGQVDLARAVAARLGLERLDTGAMYRSVAWAALRRGIDVADTAAVAALARSLDIELDGAADTARVDGDDTTAGIRTPEVDSAVSVVAANADVRTEMVRRQRAWVQARPGGVVEGRESAPWCCRAPT